MPCTSIQELPLPPPSKVGWPWTEASTPLPPVRSDGSAWPRIAIVTPSFNQGRFLEETIRSILLQGYPHLHYSVIDGGSSDESLAVIKNYAPWLDVWVSEPDRGQAHAINKGLDRANGDLFNFINSDDYLRPNALQTIGSLWRTGSAVATRVTHFQDDSRGHTRDMANCGLTARGVILGGDRHRYQQPGFWFGLDALKAIGGFDESFHYVFDWELAIRYLDAHENVIYSDEPSVMFRHHATAKTTATGSRFVVERWRSLRKIAAMPLHAGLRAACYRRLLRMAWPVLWKSIKG